MDTKSDGWQIVTTVVLVLLIVFGVPAGCSMYDTKRIADAAEKGADPIAMRCAVSAASTSREMCTVKAMQGK